MSVRKSFVIGFILALALWALVGCVPSVKEGGKRSDALDEMVCAGGGVCVLVLRLKDGTRCAMTMSNQGGVSCDWSRGDLRRGVER